MAHSNLAQALESLEWVSVRPIEKDNAPPSDSHIAKFVAVLINVKCPEKEVVLKDIILSYDENRKQEKEREDRNPLVGIKIIPYDDSYPGPTLTIIDSGVGMKKAVMEQGRRKTVVKKDDSDTSSINMSIVRETKITSKHDDDVQYFLRERNGTYPQYEMTRDTGTSIGRGTKIVLEIVKDQSKYMNKWSLYTTVGKHLQLLGWESLDEEWNRFRRGQDNVAHPVEWGTWEQFLTVRSKEPTTLESIRKTA